MFPFCGGDPSKHVMVDRYYHEGFEPYIDIHLLDRKDPRVLLEGKRNEAGIPGILVESRGHRRQLMRELGLQFGSAHPGGREV